MEALLVLFIALPIAAVAVSFACSDTAASPMGDGLVLGLLLLAVPLWPITLPLWIVYVVTRRRDQS